MNTSVKIAEEQELTKYNKYKNEYELKMLDINKSDYPNRENRIGELNNLMRTNEDIHKITGSILTDITKNINNIGEL